MLDLLAADGATVVQSAPMQSSGNLVTAKFANLTAHYVDPSAPLQVDEVARRRYVRYIRVTCSNSKIGIQELMAFDESLRNVAFGKPTFSNSENSNATFFGSNTSVNGILQGDTETETDGFISAGDCSAPGTEGSLYWQVDLQGLYNITRVIWWNRLTSADGTVVFQMLNAGFQLLDWYGNVLPGQSWTAPGTTVAAGAWTVSLQLATATPTGSVTGTNTPTMSLTSSASPTSSVSQSVGGTPAPTSSSSSSVTASPSLTSSSTSSVSRTASSTASPSTGWDLPAYARLMATSSGADVQAVELIVFSLDGSVLSACSSASIPPALQAQYSVSLAVSGQSVYSACDLVADHLNSPYMRATVSSSSLPFYTIRFPRLSRVAQAVLVQRKGSADLTGYSVTARYQLQLLNYAGIQLDQLPLQSRGGLVTAQFAPFLPVPVPNASSAFQGDEGNKRRLVRYVRVLCSNSRVNIRELHVLDYDSLSNVAYGKSTSTNSQNANATYFGSATAVDGILSNDLSPDSNGFVSAGECSAPGDIYWVSSFKMMASLHFDGD